MKTYNYLIGNKETRELLDRYVEYKNLIYPKEVFQSLLKGALDKEELPRRYKECGNLHELILINFIEDMLEYLKKQKEDLHFYKNIDIDVLDIVLGLDYKLQFIYNNEEFMFPEALNLWIDKEEKDFLRAFCLAIDSTFHRENQLDSILSFFGNFEDFGHLNQLLKSYYERIDYFNLDHLIWSKILNNSDYANDEVVFEDVIFEFLTKGLKNLFIKEIEEIITEHPCREVFEGEPIEVNINKDFTMGSIVYKGKEFAINKDLKSWLYNDDKNTCKEIVERLVNEEMGVREEGNDDEVN